MPFSYQSSTYPFQVNATVSATRPLPLHYPKGRFTLAIIIVTNIDTGSCQVEVPLLLQPSMKMSVISLAHHGTSNS